MSALSLPHLLLAQSREVIEPLRVATGDPIQTAPAANHTWMLFVAAGMCVVGAVLIAMAITRSTWWHSRRAPAEPRQGPALFAAAAEALDIPKPRAKVLLELAESTQMDPVGLLLSDHAVSRSMVASAIAQREKRLYA